MANTRSIDGTQSGRWNNYSIVWSYHPVDGMNVIITER